MARSRASLRWTVAVALLALGALHLAPFVGEGLPLLFDGHSHVARAWFVASAVADADYPAWSNHWYGGYRLLAFYAPGYYWLAGLATLVSGDPATATKWVLYGAQLVAAMAVYGGALRLGLHPPFAGVAALLWVTGAPRAWVLGSLANFPSVFVFVFLPALVWRVAAWEARPASHRRLFASQALLLGGMLLGHLANALAAVPAFLAFALHRLRQRCAGASLRRAIGAEAASLAVLPLLLLFLLIPLREELSLVALSLDDERSLRPAGLAGLAISLGLAPPAWNRFSFLHGHGALWSVLAVAAALLSLHPRMRRWRPLASGALVSLLSVVLLDQRAILALGFFLYPLAAVTLQEASRLLPRRRLAEALLAVAAAGCALASPRLGGPPVVRYADVDILAAYERLPATATASRSFDVTPSGISLDGFYGPSSFSPYVSGRSIPFGAFPQGAPLGANLEMALLSRLVEELGGPAPILSERTLDALYLSHVQLLVDRSEDPALARLDLDPEIGRRVEDGVVLLRDASPAVFAPRLAPLPAPLDEQGALGALRAAWRRAPSDTGRPASLEPLFRTGARRDWLPLLPLLRAMQLDRRGARAARIPSGHTLAAPEGQEAPGKGEFAVLAHREEAARYELVARASHAGFVRLSYSYHPDLEVRLDGVLVESIPDALGALVVAFPAGTHRIRVHAPTSVPLGLLPSAVTAALLLGLALAPGSTGSPERPGETS